MALGAGTVDAARIDDRLASAGQTEDGVCTGRRYRPGCGVRQNSAGRERERSGELPRVVQRARGGQCAGVGQRDPGGDRIGAGQRPGGACVHRNRREIDVFRPQAGQCPGRRGGGQFERTDGGSADGIAAIDGAREDRAGIDNQPVGVPGRQQHRQSAAADRTRVDHRCRVLALDTGIGTGYRATGKIGHETAGLQQNAARTLA